MLLNNCFADLESLPTCGSDGESKDDRRKFQTREDNMTQAISLRDPFLHNMDAGLMCPVSRDLLTTAVRLPCDHRVNEESAQGILNQAPAQRTCPACRAPFQAFAVDEVTRDLARLRQRQVERELAANPSLERAATAPGWPRNAAPAPSRPAAVPHRNPGVTLRRWVAPAPAEPAPALVPNDEPAGNHWLVEGYFKILAWPMATVADAFGDKTTLPKINSWLGGNS